MKVELINITNNSLELIYKAYRTCYSKEAFQGINVPTEEEMIEFIKDKINRGHYSPLEHASATFAIDGISRAAQQQLTRHRAGSYSVQSQRYVNAENFEFAIPVLEYLDHENNMKAKKLIKDIIMMSKENYKKLIEVGVKKEDARSILPTSTTGNILFSIDIRNFRNLLEQRLCVHAQSEIRELATEMNKLVKEHIPFVDYKVLRCQNELCAECKN